MLFSKQVVNKTFKKIAILGFTGILSMSANAYDAEDRAAIEKKIEVIYASAQNRDFAPLVNGMPEKIFEYMSADTDLSTADFKELLIFLSNALIDENSDIEYVIELDKAKVSTSEIGRDYLIIPTQFEMVTDDSVNKKSGNLIAFEDEGEWYLMRIEGQEHLDLIAEVYPDLTELELFETSAETYPKQSYSK